MDKLKILGWLYASLSALGLALGTGLCIGLMMEADPRSYPALQFVGPIFLMLAAVAFVPGLIGGIGLIRGRDWARIPAVITSFVLLFAFPFGTVIAAFAFWVLYDAERQSLPPTSSGGAPAPAPSPLRAPGMSTIAQYEWRNAKGILLAMAGVGSGFIVFIGAGFRINEPTTPEPFDTLFYPAIVVFALVVGYGLRSLWQSGGGIRVPRAAYRWGARRKLARERRAWAEERRQRLARLAADPRLSKYVPLIEKGESWNDDQIAYNEDRTRTVTCVHLAPIERAMREANLDVRLLFKAHIQSPCLIDEPELTRRFGPIAPARYSEFMTGERAIEDTPNAVLGCSTCDSGIRTRHRLEATLQTPVFPSPVS